MQYKLLKKNTDELIKEFDTEHPYLLDEKYDMDVDLYYDKEIEKLKAKYSKCERDFILDELKNQKSDNYNWFVKILASRALIVAIITILMNFDFKSLIENSQENSGKVDEISKNLASINVLFDLGCFLFLLFLAINMVIFIIKYSKCYNSIKRIIKVFEFMNYSDSKRLNEKVDSD